MQQILGEELPAIYFVGAAGDAGDIAARARTRRRRRRLRTCSGARIRWRSARDTGSRLDSRLGRFEPKTPSCAAGSCLTSSAACCSPRCSSSSCRRRRCCWSRRRPATTSPASTSTPAVAAAERHRLGLDRPFLVRYARVARPRGAARLRRVGEVPAGRSTSSWPSARRRRRCSASTALLLATVLGVPAGIITGSRRNLAAASRAPSRSIVVSVPPLVTSFALLLVAARTGWLPVGGFPASDAASVWTTIALSRASRRSRWRCRSRRRSSACSRRRCTTRSANRRSAPRSPRGCSDRRVVWRHALRLSLKPVLAIYGVIVGSVLSGSFAVEIVTSWPGLGALMYEALVARDLYLVAGCAAAGAIFLALGMLLSDIALALADPRVEAA